MQPSQKFRTQSPFSKTTMAAVAIICILFASCGSDSSNQNSKNHYLNDFEAYDGWVGIDGYYHLQNKDAHSGQHAYLTDTANSYSLTFARNISDLSATPVKKISLGVWIKCLALPAKGSCVMSMERAGETIKYYSVDMKESEAVANEWVQLKGETDLPTAQPKDAVIKVYFWNKGATPILIDDLEFSFDN